MTTPAPVPPPAPKPLPFPRRAFAALVVGLAAMGAVYGYFVYTGRPPGGAAERRLRDYTTTHAKEASLAAAYADADADLVADAPADAAKFLNPAELTFTAVVADDPEAAAALWKPLMDAVAAKTGKKVTYLRLVPGVAQPTAAPPTSGKQEVRGKAADPLPLEVRDAGLQAELVRDGKLHVTAFTTGQVPAAVNAAGFVPLFCPAAADGTFAAEAVAIAPAGGPAQTVADLRGRGLPPFALTALSSNSGAKAPLVAFKRDHRMLPGRDYEFVLTGSHELSILGVCVGKSQAARQRQGGKADAPADAGAPDDRYPLACVAADVLARMVARGEVKPEQFRTLWKSPAFPPLCFGVPHDLDPALRKNIEAAFAEFAFAATPAGPAKFARIDYRRDWQPVRDVDAQFAKLLD